MKIEALVYSISLCAISAKAVTLDVGLLAHYTFNNSTLDQSGNNRDASAVNTTFVVDRFGNPVGSIQFNGINSYVFAANVWNTENRTATTVSMWFKPYLTSSRPVQTNPNHEYVLYSTVNSPGNNVVTTGMNMFQNSIVQGSYQGSLINPGPTEAFIENGWNHLIFVGDTSTQTSKIIVYKSDGNISSKTEASFSFGSQLPPNLLFGIDRLLRDPYASPEYDTSFYGEMDDIRIYDRAVSDLELTQLHTLESVPEPSALSLLAVGLGGLAIVRRRRS